jgi:N-acetylneuraminic acid mutarotase
MVTRFSRYILHLLIVFACTLACLNISRAQNQAGRNVNMVSGTHLPDGDPWLQRQNEPSIAVSTRNPLHILAGANDYRTVDMPSSEGELPGTLISAAPGDAWLGIYKSFDGGQTWKSTLLPGFPQDLSLEGMASPLKQYKTAADPGVRAGANGLFYYSGIAFNRTKPRVGSLFVARFIDNNNTEVSDPIQYLDTKILDTGTDGNFIDMPSIAVDVPRPTKKNTTVVINNQTIPVSNVYVVYSQFKGQDPSYVHGSLYFMKSSNCGKTWEPPIKLSEGDYVIQGARIAIDPETGTVYVVWRRFAARDQGNSIQFAKSVDFGTSFSKVGMIASITPFDQPATDAGGNPPIAFRTNSYPTIAVDSRGVAHCAWSQKGVGLFGESKIVMSNYNGTSWSSPVPVDNSLSGHQFMPALTFAAEKLVLVWYDQRNTAANEFNANWINDGPGNPVRQTVDVFAAQADPGLNPSFATKFQVSKYLHALGAMDNNGNYPIYQVQYNPPNYTLFKGGSTPFAGDFIDIAPSPAFVLGSDGKWKFNTDASSTPLFHVSWTDNRDVRPPVNNDWTQYNTPVSNQGIYGSGTCSNPKNVGMRNQNIYTSRLSNEAEVGAYRNNKPLGTVGKFSDGKPVPRAFVVYVRNYSYEMRSYRLKIESKPANGNASFSELAQVDSLDANASPNSTIARTVFVASTNAAATAKIGVYEVVNTTENWKSTIVLNQDTTTPGIPSGDDLATKEIYNPNIVNPNIVNWDVTNPNIVNPNIVNPNIVNPNIVNVDAINPNIVNPNIVNPNIVNPNIVNPNIVNPNIVNPNIVNPNIVNPNIVNPNIVNPNIVNPNIVNMAVTDVNWDVRNDGNTTGTYNLKLYSKEQLPVGVFAQLIVYKESFTPASGTPDNESCDLKIEPHHDVLLNITNPNIVNPNIVNPNIVNPNIVNAALENSVFRIMPGETIKATVRIVDTNQEEPKTVMRMVEDSSSPTKTQLVSALFDLQTFAESLGVAAVSQAINTQDLQSGKITPPVAATRLVIATESLPDGTAGSLYNDVTLIAVGGTTPFTWSLNSGELPPGLSLSTGGVISGTISQAAQGTYSFVVRVDDSTPAPNAQFDTQRYSISVNAPSPSVPSLSITTASVPSGVLGFWYGATLEAVGGTWPRTWSLVSGSLPTGLTLNGNGTISGTPMGAGGSFSFVVLVTDSSTIPKSVTGSFTINIAASAPGAEITISGFVNDSQSNPLGGVVMRGLPNTPVTGINGYYEDRVPIGWSGTVLPFKAGSYFSPESRIYGSLSSNQADQNYNWIVAQPSQQPPADLASFVVDAPPNAIEGVPFTITITAKDSNGNTTTNVSGPTTLSVNFGHISVTTIPDTEFIYTGIWTGLVTLTQTGTRTVNISASNNGKTGSDPLSVARLGSVSFVTQPTVSTAGQNILPSVQVEVRDTSNAVVPGAKVFLSIGAGTCPTCSLTGNTERQTNGLGIATFDNIQINRGGWDYTLRASVAVLPVTGESNIFDVIGFRETGSMGNARDAHTATLLPGGKVLVVGGYNDGALASSELYDPAGKTWSSTITAPGTAREWHTATLLPNGKVLVTGGWQGTVSSGNAVASAELYDPGAGTWSTTGSMANARYLHTATFLPNGKVLVAGGTTNDGTTSLSSAELYDPATGTFSPTGSMNSGRWIHLATLLPNGKVLVAGGWQGTSSAGHAIASAELYDPATGTWSPTTPMSVARDAHTLTLLPNGRVLAIGGYDGTNILNTAEVYDPTAGTWSATGSMAVTRVGHADVLLSSGKVLVAGGNGSTGSGTSAELYDPVAGTWSVAGSMATSRYWFTMTLLSNNGAVLVAGGSNYPGSDPFGKFGMVNSELFYPNGVQLVFTTQPVNGTAGTTMALVRVRAVDRNGNGMSGVPVNTGIVPSNCKTCTLSGNAPQPTNLNGYATFSNLSIDKGSWGYKLVASSDSLGLMAASEPFNVVGFCETGSMVTGHQEHTATLLPNGKVLIAGGHDGTSTYLTTAELYDPATGLWSATSPMHFARAGHRAILLNNGLVLVMGGRDGTTRLDSAELYNPGERTWTITGSLNVPREYFTATLLPDGKVLVAAGRSPGVNSVNSAELYDPDSQLWSYTGSLTEARIEHTATLLPNGKVLVAGGLQTYIVLVNSCELYDPATGLWSTINPLHYPRGMHTAALLQNGKVLVAGGLGGSPDYRWVAELYDPDSGHWSDTGSILRPSESYQSVLLPDGRVLIVGGGSVDSELYDPMMGTWTNAGNAMVRRLHHQLVLLPAGNVLAVGGGAVGFSLNSAELFYSNSTINGSRLLGSILFNGAPLLTTRNLRITAIEQTSGHYVPISPSYDSGTGRYTIPNMAPGSYYVIVTVDDDGQLFPGDYYGETYPVVVPPAPQLVVRMLTSMKIIHLTSPVNNNPPGFSVLPPPYDTYLGTPPSFSWDPIPEASQYEVIVWRMQDDGSYAAQVVNTQTSDTEIVPGVPTNPPGTHYQFILYALNDRGERVAMLMVVYPDYAFGWDYRFKFE